MVAVVVIHQILLKTMIKIVSRKNEKEIRIQSRQAGRVLLASLHRSDVGSVTVPHRASRSGTNLGIGILR